MRTEFRLAAIPDELRALTYFDRKIFPTDHFPASAWRACETWWLLVDGRKAGCCAFEKHVDFRDDLSHDGENPPHPGSLYIATTGILPRCQRQGLGTLMKAWQIAYARRHGFHRIVTNTRKSNKVMISLNRRFGFRILRTTPHYYADPDESTVVMEAETSTSETRPRISPPPGNAWRPGGTRQGDAANDRLPGRV
jgi:ribosomal protein S18 acetylase RimI-like enzyme